MEVNNWHRIEIRSTEEGKLHGRCVGIPFLHFPVHTWPGKRLMAGAWEADNPLPVHSGLWHRKPAAGHADDGEEASHDGEEPQVGQPLLERAARVVRMYHIVGVALDEGHTAMVPFDLGVLVGMLGGVLVRVKRRRLVFL